VEDPCVNLQSVREELFSLPSFPSHRDIVCIKEKKLFRKCSLND